MRYTLANKFGTPDHGKWGVSDFPGIDGVELKGWDLDRGSHLALRGTLTRENAPALPWEDGIIEVGLTGGHGDYTTIDVEVDDEEVDLLNLPDLGHNRADRVWAITGTMESAVEDAMHEAMRDGRAEMEHKTGPEWAEEVASDREFYADGSLYA
jgi:hypothetical protein